MKLVSLLSSTLLFLALLSGSFASAQAPEATAPQLSKNKPTAVVVDHGWSDNQELVISIIIHAPTSQTFNLGFLSEDEFVVEGNAVFTTKESYITDQAGQKFASVQKIPSKPNYGRIKTATPLRPGDKMEFTGAYPFPIPKGADGLPVPGVYVFTLHLPCGVPDTTFSIPYPPKP